MAADDYEARIRLVLRRWERKITKPSSTLETTSKAIQDRIHAALPARVQQTITTTVQSIFQSVLFGLDFVPDAGPLTGLSLQERDRRAEAAIASYKKIAAAEGAGTGFGGFAFSLVDFPALIAIKMKCLFELARIYGFLTTDRHERLFLLYVFQLAFSAREHRIDMLHKIRHWHDAETTLPDREKALQTIDWETLQQQYRDALDLRKLLQMIPGFGAVVGAWANYGLLDELGETAMNAYRMRLLHRSE